MKMYFDFRTLGSENRPKIQFRAAKIPRRIAMETRGIPLRHAHVVPQRENGSENCSGSWQAEREMTRHAPEG